MTGNENLSYLLFALSHNCVSSITFVENESDKCVNILNHLKKWVKQIQNCQALCSDKYASQMFQLQ